MSEPIELESSETANAPRAAKRRMFCLPDGQIIPASEFETYTKFEKDVIVFCHGEEKVMVPAKGKNKMKVEWRTVYDPEHPLPVQAIEPGPQSPICIQCKLHGHDCRHPFMPYAGSEKPLVTILFEGVTRAEDNLGMLGLDGSPAHVRRIIQENSRETGVTLDDVRWVPMTRCANCLNKKVDLKPRGRWCRYHVIDDLMRHPPALIMPVGTTALGLLSHKSNAQEWSGRLLTYRGWPDDWLTHPKYALPHADPRQPAQTLTGHPLFGAVPEIRIPMVPIQSPRLIFATQNPIVYTRWSKQIVRALKMAKEGIVAPSYTRPWYRYTEDPRVVERVLNGLLNYPGILLSYDTETTGLRPWADDAAIVSIMLRWVDPPTGEPRSLGFPWDFGPTAEHPDYLQSPLRAHIGQLKQLLWKVLTRSCLVGHNITFDMLFTYATFWRSRLSGWEDAEFNIKRDGWVTRLADACQYDTWHMAFTWLQKRGSYGLEVLAYEWVPDLAGYEEDMTLLIDLHCKRMHPDAGEGGHYLNGPPEKKETHLVPYIMGDVEVCYQAHGKILKKLENSKVYEFPLAHPEYEGRFRYFRPPDRHWVYHNIVSPASRVLMKMMARGLFIDLAALDLLEETMPRNILETRNNLKIVDERISDWCKREKAQNAQWELDLENKGQLKELLFEVLEVPVLRFTKQGRKDLGDDVKATTDRMRQIMAEDFPDLNEAQLEAKVQKELQKVAAVDKFTLNKICAENKDLIPLQNYRKLFKLYSTYVRPLRNIFSAGLDKKEREHARHLSFDQCIHASFLLTGTRGGRLSCRDPNLQQLPRDGVVKSLFVSRFGSRGCMYQGDLSQIELRLMAAVCGDPTMIEAYNKGTDLHSLTASRIYNVPYEHFTKAYMEELQKKGHAKEAKELELKRVTAKTTNFLTGYGGGAFGLQNVLAMNNIGKQIEECQEIIELFFDSYPALKRFLMRYKRFILETEVAVSIFGRVRVFEEVRGDDEEAKAKALRAGCNHLIQATASDMMLTALVIIERKMREAGLESIVVSTVHDSLVIDCVRVELPQVHQIVSSVLNNFPRLFKAVFGTDYDTSWMLVPFSGDCEVGLDYLNTRKIPAKDIDWDKLLAE